jgi:hypothetical protein
MNREISVVRVNEGVYLGQNRRLFPRRPLPAAYRELPERVEPEGMANRLRCRMAPGRGILPNAGTICSIHRFLKRNANLPRRVNGPTRLLSWRRTT